MIKLIGGEHGKWQAENLLGLRFCRRCLKWKQWNLPAHMAWQNALLSMICVSKNVNKITCFHKVGEKTPEIHGTEFRWDVLDSTVRIHAAVISALHCQSVPIGPQPRRFRSYRGLLPFKFKMADGEMSETSDAHNEGKEPDSQTLESTGPPSKSKSNPQGITVYCRLRPVPKVLACSMFVHDRLQMYR